MLNSGHPIRSARWEAGNVRDVLSYYSAAPERLFGRQIPVSGGLEVAFAGSAPTGPGFWLPPSLVLPSSPQNRIWREEIFGPDAPNAFTEEKNVYISDG